MIYPGIGELTAKGHAVIVHDPHADPAEAGHYLVRDEQDVVVTTNLAYLLQVPLRRKIDPTGTDDGLAEEGGDLVGTDFLDERQQALRIVPSDSARVRHQLAVVLSIHRNTGQRSTSDMHSVVSLFTSHNERLPRLAHLVPVTPGQFRRCVDRVGTTRGEEHLATHNGRDLPEPLRECQRRLRNEISEVGVVSQRSELGGDGAGVLALDDDERQAVDEQHDVRSPHLLPVNHNPAVASRYLLPSRSQM